VTDESTGTRNSMRRRTWFLVGGVVLICLGIGAFLLMFPASDVEALQSVWPAVWLALRAVALGLAFAGVWCLAKGLTIGR
jgi:O-antigen/teichoic acid export membrane protein